MVLWAMATTMSCSTGYRDVYSACPQTKILGMVVMLLGQGCVGGVMWMCEHHHVVSLYCSQC
jgi:hypothetical protein